MDDADDLFERLVIYHQIGTDRRGEAHIRCPNPDCPNPEPKSDAVHFSFSAKGGKCFVCGEGWSLHRLAAIWLGDDYATTNPLARAADLPAVVAKRRRADYPALWIGQSVEWYASRYQKRLDLLQCWQGYKPVSLDSVASWKLGVGRLPFFDEDRKRWYWSKHQKLVVPVFRNGKLIALRGRAFSPDDPTSADGSGKKWMNATGVTTCLFNGELIRPGDSVLVVENMIDAILIMQFADEARRVAGMGSRLVAVASTAGAGTWRPTWTAHLASMDLAELVVALDNDLAGQPNKETLPLAIAQWKAKHPSTPSNRAPKPNGPRIANELLLAGVPSRLYHWPEGTPLKADPLSWFVG